MTSDEELAFYGIALWVSMLEIPTHTHREGGRDREPLATTSETPKCTDQTRKTSTLPSRLCKSKDFLTQHVRTMKNPCTRTSFLGKKPPSKDLRSKVHARFSIYTEV